MGGGGSYTSYNRRIIVDNNNDCDKIHFLEYLQNIQPSIIKYKVGDVLEVKYNAENTISVEGIHGVCGYITAMPSTQLIMCLKKGKEFIATIIVISSSSCRVEITPL